MGMGGYKIPTYQGGFTTAMRGVGEAIMGRRAKDLEAEKNKLAQAAWMGDPGAIEDLVRLDPRMAAQIEDRRIKREEATAQTTMAKTAAFKQDMDRVMGQIAKFDTFEEAQAFGQRMTDQMRQKYPERWAQHGMPEQFNEEAFAQIQTIAGPAVETAVVDGRLVNKATGEVIYEMAEGERISKRKTLLIDTPEGQKLVDAATGELIETFAAKPITAKPKAPTAAQDKASAFLVRMKAAEVELDRVTVAYPDFDPAAKGETLMAMSNITSSAAMRQYKQAANDWIRAKLRPETGAVIGAQEMIDEYNIYFPIAGDDPETIAQKLRARGVAEKQMKIMAGAAWKEPEPEPEPKVEPPPTTTPGLQAPPGALEYLAANPGDLAAFVEKYHYTPEGF